MDFLSQALRRVRMAKVVELILGRSGSSISVRNERVTAPGFRGAVESRAEQLVICIWVPIRGAGSVADFSELLLGPDGRGEAERYLTAPAGEERNLSANEIHIRRLGFNRRTARVQLIRDPHGDSE